jgi:hypothetical protein
MAPVSPAVITTRGLIFQPCALIASTNGLYLPFFFLYGLIKESIMRKSDSIIWMVRSGVGISGPFCSYATPCV